MKIFGKWGNLYDKTIQSINDIKFFNSADKNTIDAIINTFEHQKELSLNHILKSLINDYFNKVFFRINNPKNEKFHFDIDWNNRIILRYIIVYLPIKS